MSLRSFCYRASVLFAALVACVALRAQPTLLDENFALTSDRSTQNLPASLAWYVAGASSNLAVKNSALDLASAGAQRDVWAYFPAVSLKVGDSLTLTLDFNFTAAPAQVASGLRFALGYTNGVTPTTANGAAPTGNYQGYGSFTDASRATGATRLRKRNGPAAANATAALLEVNDGTAAIWNDLASTTGLAGPSQANVPYTAVLKVTRTDTTTVAVTMSFSGGGLNGGTNTFTLTDSTNAVTTFDTLALDVQGAVLPGDLLITHAQLSNDRASAVLNETFASGDRSTQKPPASLAWYHNTTTASNLAVKNGALDIVVANDVRVAWAYFPTVNLKVGESLALTLDFSFTAPADNGFRIALCSTNGVAPVTADLRSGVSGNYLGYGIFDGGNLNRTGVYKRDGVFASNSTSLLLDSLGSGATTIWSTHVFSSANNGPTVANTPYTAVLKITRTGTDTAVVTSFFSGTGVTTNGNLTLNDSAGIVSSFDTIAIDFITNVLAGDMLVTRANLTATTAPSVATQPVARGVSVGANATFTVGVAGDPAPTIQWQRLAAGSATWANLPENATYVGTTTGALFVNGVVANMDGDQFRAVLSNGIVTATSNAATLNVVPASTVGRIINLSILTGIASAGDAFTMGYVVGGDGTSGTKPVVIRAAGPSLGALGVPGTIDAPKIELFAGATKTNENTAWGGGADLAAAMAGVGAFGYASATSKDSAIATSLPKGDNSVKVSAANGTSTGAVIAEIYDATPASTFAAATPRLVNVSVLKQIGTGLTAGFVIGGSTAKAVLVRAVGPSLGSLFGVPGVLIDPQATLFNSSQVKLGTNSGWGGNTALSAAFTRTGAFALPIGSGDAALVATLPPGNYTVQVASASGAAGVALVEVYELP